MKIIRLWSDRLVYRFQVFGVERLKTKSEYYHNRLSEAANHKDVYSIAIGLLFGRTVRQYLIHESASKHSEQFTEYFIPKIVT